MSRLIWNHISLVATKTDAHKVDKCLDQEKGLLESMHPIHADIEPEVAWGCRERVWEFFGEINGKGISFDSLRQPPVKAVIEFSKKFPDVTFRLGWFCEDEMFGGMYEIENGKDVAADFESEEHLIEFAHSRGYYFDDEC